MKYLTNPEASLVTMWVAARHLREFGPNVESDVFTALRPPQLTRGEGSALRSSISIACDLGLLVRGAEAIPTLSLGEKLAEDVAWVDTFDAFASVARRLLMSQASVSPDDRSDVANGVVWLTSRDWRQSHNPLQDDDRPLPGTISTETQVGAFRRWCIELGMTVPGANATTGSLRPDPTPALRYETMRLGANRYNAREFVERVGESLVMGPRHPLAGGPKEANAVSDLMLFSAIGYGLRRLEAEGRIRLVVSDDASARNRALLPFPAADGAIVSITHVEVGV